MKDIIVVIGGGAAGMTFASQYKKMNNDSEIYVIEKSNYVAWAGCPTPYFIGDKIEKKALIHGSIETFKSRGINILINTEAVFIDHENKKLFIISNNKKEHIQYTKLVYAVGATPNYGSFKKNIDENGVFVLNHVADAYSIKNYIEKKSPKKILIVGAGYTGLEVAENLKELGIDVTILKRTNNDILPEYSNTVKKKIEKLFKENNIEIHKNSGIKDIIFENNHLKSVSDVNENYYNCDMVLLSLGIKPNTNLLKNIKNIKFAENDGVIVDEKFVATEDIYAIGDCIVTKNYLNNQNQYAPFGDVADKQGLLLAHILNGKNVSYKGVIGASGTSFFGYQIARVGLTEDQARNVSNNIKIINVNGFSKIKAFKDSEPIKFEIVYNAEKDTVLGACAIGKDAVAQFIDSFSIIIDKKIKVEELINMDFVYSPTISTVWNPMLALYRKIYRGI